MKPRPCRHRAATVAPGKVDLVRQESLDMLDTKIAGMPPRRAGPIARATREDRGPKTCLPHARARLSQSARMRLTRAGQGYPPSSNLATSRREAQPKPTIPRRRQVSSSAVATPPRRSNIRQSVKRCFRIIRRKASGGLLVCENPSPCRGQFNMTTRRACRHR
jgi:hypothetical protein